MLRDHGLDERFRAILGLLLLASILSAASGCGGTIRQQHDRLNALTTIADPTYAQVVELCREMRAEVVQRTGTTREEDHAALDVIDAKCDPAVVGFETLRGTQRTARVAIDEGFDAAAQAAIVEALALWPQIQALARQLGLGDEEE